jgi:predicted transglutaminase-like cysteine proteinase
MMLKAMSVAALCAAFSSAAIAQPARTPAGAGKLCSDYPWACSAAATGTSDPAAILQLAKSVNRKVNFSIREVSDRAQYGIEEKWTLPKDAGDCEDFALLKMRMLIDQGVAPANLRLAQVMKRRVLSHVVLLVRTAPTEEYVLDSLSGSVSPRSASSYVFLKQQSRTNPAHWEAALGS